MTSATTSTTPVRTFLVNSPVVDHSSLLGSNTPTGPRRPLTLAFRRRRRRRLLHLFLAPNRRRCRLLRRRRRLHRSLLCSSLCSRSRTSFGVGAILESGGGLFAVAVSLSNDGCGRGCHVGDARRSIKGRGTRRK